MVQISGVLVAGARRWMLWKLQMVLCYQYEYFKCEWKTVCTMNFITNPDSVLSFFKLGHR